MRHDTTKRLLELGCRLVCGLGTVWLTSCAAHASPGLPDPPADLRAEPTHGRIAARIRVLGRVVDAEGRPVADVRVRMQAHPRPACGGGRGAWDETTSRDDGWFLETLYFYSLVSTRSCITVWTESRVGGSVVRDSVSDLPATFLQRGAVDTIRVQLVLRSR